MSPLDVPIGLGLVALSLVSAIVGTARAWRKAVAHTRAHLGVEDHSPRWDGERWVW